MVAEKVVNEPIRRPLRLERAPWDALDDSFAARIPFDHPAGHVDDLQRLCAAGRASAHRLIVDDRRIGVAVIQVEEARFRELVVVAVFSSSDAPISFELAQACEALARAEGCISIRFHTCRESAARFAAAHLGYRLTEIVMRKAIAPTPHE